jgi:hypothetical protein
MGTAIILSGKDADVTRQVQPAAPRLVRVTCPGITAPGIDLCTFLA